MNEEMIKLAMKDERVKIDFLLKNKVHVFEALPTGDVDGIVIYCHGMGSNKSWAIRFYERLLEKNIGVLAFDLPGHGEDKSDFLDFSLDLCLSYLEEVILYVKNKYHKKIYLFGSSYGGFVLLNRICRCSSDIVGTVLMCPAVNFLDIIERRGNILLDEYFKNHEFVPLIGDSIGFYKKNFNGFKDGQKNIDNFDFCNVSIISGSADRTVLLDDVLAFCNKNHLRLETISGGKHELYGYEDDIVRFILEIIK